MVQAVDHNAGPVTRIDAHCHSSASSGPVNAAAGMIGCPECYSPPEKVYDLAMARGMDLVTLTDHDTIAGALELVERGFERVVVGEEVTVHFPEDGCKLHVLVWLLTPDLHEQIGTLGLRDDVYAFAAWLREKNLPHSLAHPLYIQNRKLTLWHLERCALLFKGFETLNGAHSGTHRSGVEAFLASLTPGKVHRLIEKHSLEPHWARIWEKARTGGSDDHALLNVGRAWTGVTLDDAREANIRPECVDASGTIADPREFFRAVMSGRSHAGGAAGHSSLLAHQLTTVAANYSARRLGGRSALSQEVAARALRFAGIDAPRPSKIRLGLSVLASKVRRRRRPTDPLVQALSSCARDVLANYPDLKARLSPEGISRGSALSEHDRMAEFADDLYAGIHAVLGSGALRAVREKDHKRIFDHVASYAMLELSQLPYLFSLFHQNKERDLVEQVEHESAEPGDGTSVLERPMRVMLFTDTLGDVNGVSRFIRNVAARAQATGRRLQVVTSTTMPLENAPNITNVPPVFSTEMPRYPQLQLALPPLVRLLRIADRFQPDVIHVSTPGPVGLAGIIASKMLRTPVAGVYHTDFPAYVEALFDESAGYMCAQAMRTFYAPFGAVFTRSHEYSASLQRLGIPESRIVPLQPGIMTEQFHPRFRDERTMQALGSPAGCVRVLYVGRVSVEKNLPLLTQVWKAADRRLRDLGVNAELVVIGDGPYRAEMERALRPCRARFLGFRHAEELSRLYASGDLFVFPSVTDTLGQVVMEAQSSGMPVIVSDQGGPREVVQDGVTGYVLSPDAPRAWIDRIVALAENADTRRTMGEAAHLSMRPYSMERSFEHYWRVHERVWLEHLSRRGIAPRSPGQAARLAEVVGPDASPATPSREFDQVGT
ncbi:MAG: glycosyltransferase [Planctomycetota bacterium]|nr:glycosyltransferase [Planctomycetota bacterium]